MFHTTDDVKETAPFEHLALPARHVYDLMVEAHRAAAEDAAYSRKEASRWLDDGAPTRVGRRTGKNIPVEGYAFLTPMMLNDIESYLVSMKKRLDYLGASLNTNVVISYEQYQEFTTPRRRTFIA